MRVAEALHLIAAYGYSSRGSHLAEAARFDTLMGQLGCGLSDADVKAVCQRLRLYPERLTVKWQLKPPLEVLREGIDRRPVLGIADVRADVEQEYRIKGRDVGERKGREAAA